MTDVVTYHSVNAKPAVAWIGYAVGIDGNPIHVRFEGPDEQQVINRARAWYQAERARQLRLEGGATPVAGEAQNLTSEAPIKPDNTLDHHMVGKVWMINRTTHERARVDPDQVASYMDRGFIKGGPRSK